MTNTNDPSMISVHWFNEGRTPSPLEALEAMLYDREEWGWDYIDPRLEAMWPMFEAAIRKARGE